MVKQAKLSPGRRQYLEFKRQFPDALLLFRMGDFYETFDEDARVTARVLDITLTQRDVGGGVKAPLAGIPHHALNAYLGRLIRAGLKVAICEQTSDPTTSKGVVDRAVTRVVTPGTVLEPGLLDENRNNYLAAVVATEDRAGLAFADITTGDFSAGELDTESLRDELFRLEPAEVLVDTAAKRVLDNGDGRNSWTTRDIDHLERDAARAAESLMRHFQVASLIAFELDGLPLATVAAAALVRFLEDTQITDRPKLSGIRPFRRNDHLVLDRRVLRDLEVVEPIGGQDASATLRSVLDRTRTAMGRRLLRTWLVRPLVDLEPLRRRQDVVQAFVEHAVVRRAVRERLGKMADLERILGRVRTFTASPREVASLGASLAVLPDLAKHLGAAGGGSEATGDLATRVKPCPEIAGLIRRALVDDPPAVVGDGRSIRHGFDEELDEIRGLAGDARGRIAAIEQDARERTGIRSLKVGYNKVFGYYIEVSKANLAQVPQEFERRQTLVNAERFITPELKELESRILTARDRIADAERALFRRVCKEVNDFADRIAGTAQALAELDVQAAFAEAASADGYVRPLLDESEVIEIRGGRHPVVEQAVGRGVFVPNDAFLSTDEQQLGIVTGPNMAGKSTYIRQVALLVLMAQVGSFIPADSARIGLVDRIFTRCNLTDNIAQGRSTFLVEMEETAVILSQATRRSLVVLDEIGRGTSTYDGLAIARAVAEHLHSSPKLGCKTLFATHYHELTALADLLPRAFNLQVAVSEEGNNVVFLHRILPGGADQSYGVHVARLAGLPPSVVARAWDILGQLESAPEARMAHVRDSASRQLPLMPEGSLLRDALLKLDISSMTPLEAITKLYELQAEANRDGL